MDESNFSLQRALDGSYLNISLKESIQLDGIAIKVIDEECPDFLVPFRLVNFNDGITLKYKLTNDVALGYASMVFNKSAFIDFYQTLLRPFLQGADWFLDYHYLCISENHIYLSKNMSKAQYIYIPEASYRNSDEEIVKFFYDVLTKVEITDDASFLLKLYQYFSKNAVLLTELDEMLRNEKLKGTNVQKVASNPQNQNLVEPTQSIPIIENSAPTDRKLWGNRNPFGKQQDTKAQSVVENIVPEPPKQVDSSDDIMEALFGDEPKKKKEKKEKPKKEKQKSSFNLGLFGKKHETEQPLVQQPVMQQIVEPDSKTEINNGSYGYGGGLGDETVISGDYNGNNQACLELVDSAMVGAIQRISLEFPSNYITIGRESNDVNQANIKFNIMFKQISRMHARITRNDSVYTIIDIGSANGTMLNNQTLIPNNPYIMKDGDKITFACGSNKPVIYKVIL